MKPAHNGGRYWMRLILAASFSLLLASAGTILWISYQQTISYLHPARQTASGALLNASGIDFKDIELLTEDNVKLSAWYKTRYTKRVIRFFDEYILK